MLTAFYIKPASGDRGGSVEFVHKSFCEFLFAERLLESFVDWTVKVSKRQREEDLISTIVMDWQIYDLLGYGNLTPAIAEYLMGLLTESLEFQDVERLCRLFQRLEHFYFRWCDGEFIDADDVNLPQMKKKQLREQLPERENHLGLRQVDVYTEYEFNLTQRQGSAVFSQGETLKTVASHRGLEVFTPLSTTDSAAKRESCLRHAARTSVGNLRKGVVSYERLPRKDAKMLLGNACGELC